MSGDTVIGWDIGGANLKAAALGADGGLRVFLEPCPLHRGQQELPPAMRRILDETGIPHHQVITMTGELADCFPDRAEGVRALVRMAWDLLGDPEGISCYSRDGKWLSPASALARPVEVASANWRATAQVAAASVPEALVVDIGSTTTDLVPVQGGEVRAAGASDDTRLQAGELVYSGVVRTPVMALGGRVPLEGGWVPLTAERFATMADVHRLRGVLPEGADPGPTADEGRADLAGSARRLARMVGRDLDTRGPAPWRPLADYLAERQLRDLLDAAFQVLGRAPLTPEAPVVGAGVGRFLAADLAGRLGRPYLDFGHLVPESGPEPGPAPADCAPAVALALLAREDPS